MSRDKIPLAEKIPGWLERVLLPQITELKGEVKVLSARIDGLDEKIDAKIDGLDQKLTARIDGLEGRMDSEFKLVHGEIRGLDDKIDALDKRTDVTQRLTVVEEQLRELRAKA